tara:strand:+ start:913 stop:1170 length:258 start_codon:yes stop_codon:yes gene_type:complete
MAINHRETLEPLTDDALKGIARDIPKILNEQPTYVKAHLKGRLYKAKEILRERQAQVARQQMFAESPLEESVEFIGEREYLRQQR